MLTIRGVEIARIGTFQCETGPCRFTAAQFDAAVAAAKELDGSFDAPVKLGHDGGIELPDGMPAAGWLANLRRDGDRLIADIRDMPEKVAALVRNGTLSNRSVELMEGVKLAGKRYPAVVTGLALLGAELPAVDSLNEIAKLFAGADLEADRVIHAAAQPMRDEDEDADPDSFDALLARIDALLDRAERHVKFRNGAPAWRSAMREARAQLRKLGARRAARGPEGGDHMDPKMLRAALGLAEDASDEDVTAAIKAGQAAIEAAKEKPGEGGGGDGDAGSAELRRELAETKAALAKTSGAVVKLQEERDRAAIAGEVDSAIHARKVLPARRDALIKIGEASGLDALQLVLAEMGERPGEAGSTGTPGDTDLAQFEPTEAEMRVAAQYGNSRNDVIRTKAEAAGVVLPDDFGKPKSAAGAGKDGAGDGE